MGETRDWNVIEEIILNHFQPFLSFFYFAMEIIP
jgi:hypothetical protein